MWKLCCYDAKAVCSCDDVNICDAFVDWSETLDAFCPSVMDEKRYSTCAMLMPASSDDVLTVFCGPELLLLRAPSFVDRDNVPIGVVKFCQKFV